MSFGAPMLGDRDVAKFVNEKNFSRNLFNFASAWDIVPALLSVGHGLESLKKQNTFFVGSVIGNLPNMWYNICLKGLNLGNSTEDYKEAKKVLKAKKIKFAK